MRITASIFLKNKKRKEKRVQRNQLRFIPTSSKHPKIKLNLHADACIQDMEKTMLTT